jgi:hypothetical protein
VTISFSNNILHHAVSARDEVSHPYKTRNKEEIL